MRKKSDPTFEKKPDKTLEKQVLILPNFYLLKLLFSFVIKINIIDIVTLYISFVNKYRKKLNFRLVIKLNVLD